MARGEGGTEIKRRRFKFLLTMTIMVALVIAAFYNDLVLRRYSLTSPLLGDELTVVVISDLHSYSFGDGQERLLKKIHQQNPDLILLVGDIIDNVYPIAGALDFLAGIMGLCPIYYVTGNHELWASNPEAFREIVRSYGGVVLSDSYDIIEIKGNKLLIAGVEDPDKQRFEDRRYNHLAAMTNAFGDLSDGMYAILLAHRPELIKYYLSFSFDLIVSGHTHGGQLRIPFLLNGLIAPNKELFPPYAGGVYHHGKTTHIVSRGVSYRPDLPRVFNPPEVVVIKLRGSFAK